MSARRWLAAGLAAPLVLLGVPQCSVNPFPTNTPDVQALAHPEIAAVSPKSLQITQLVFVDAEPRAFTADVTLERFEVFQGIGWHEVAFHKWDKIELPAVGTQGNLVWTYPHCIPGYWRLHIKVYGVSHTGTPWGPRSIIWPVPDPGSKKIHGVRIRKCVK